MFSFFGHRKPPAVAQGREQHAAKHVHTEPNAIVAHLKVIHYSCLTSSCRPSAPLLLSLYAAFRDQVCISPSTSYSVRRCIH